MYLKKIHLLAYPGSHDELSCCLDLYEKGLSALDHSEQHAPDCLYPLLPKEKTFTTDNKFNS